MTREWTCQGCGTTGTGPARGRMRKWCSDSCRKQACYTGICVDCSGRTGYSGTAIPPARCRECQNELQRASARWTRESILAALHRWNRLHGRPPAAGQWLTVTTPGMGTDWPYTPTVQTVFGSWNAAIIAAGFAPMVGGHKRIELERAA